MELHEILSDDLLSLDASTDDDIAILSNPPQWQQQASVRLLPGGLDPLYSTSGSSGYESTRSVPAPVKTPVTAPVTTPVTPPATSPVPVDNKIVPPFPTPTKLVPVEQVLQDNPGASVANLRTLSIALARDAIFGKEEMIQKSLSGRKGTMSLDSKKLDYIKAVVKARVPKITPVEFEYVWGLCRSSISKSCQCMRVKSRKKIL